MARPVDNDLNPRDFERLCETAALDLVFTATPWAWHVPVMPAAMTLDDGWAIERMATGAGHGGMDFPDFTRGGWRTNPKLGIVTV